MTSTRVEDFKLEDWLPFWISPDDLIAFLAACAVLVAFLAIYQGMRPSNPFDRRYGALKRLGATPLPVWGIIAGKSLAVVAVVFLQAVSGEGPTAAVLPFICDHMTFADDARIATLQAFWDPESMTIGA